MDNSRSVEPARSDIIGSRTDKPAAFATVGATGLARHLPNFCFSCFIFVAFVGFSPILTGTYEGSAELADTGDSLRQAVFAMTFALIAAATVLTSGWRALLKVPIAFVVLLLWCWASVTWAIDPAVSLRRVLFTTVVALSVVWSVNMLSVRQALSSLGWWLALIVLADWAVMPFVTMAVHQSDGLEPLLAGDWRGIHNHKNEAGALCVVATMMFGEMALCGVSRITAPALAGLSLGFLAMTASKTSIGFLFVAVVLGVVVDRSYRNPNLGRFLAAAGVCLAVLLGIEFAERTAEVAAFFDDPASLTGRVQIWPMLLRYAANHLFLGSGYGSFWEIGDASPINNDGPHWLTKIAHAHNGYLDLLVQVGIVGLGFAIGGLVVRPLYRLSTQPLPVPRSRWLLATIIIFCLLHNLLESSLMDRSNIVWVFMLIAYTLLERRTEGGVAALPARPMVARPVNVSQAS